MEAEASVMFQGVAKQSAAFRLMQQMGWEEGNGLGKDLQGMKSHIRVSKKSDTSGIGLDAKAKAQANWALNTHAYDSILKNLKVQVAVTATEDGGDSSSSDEDNDDPKKDEVVEETKVRKVARPQGRYKKREQGKMVGAYSSTDLAAILGAVVGKTATDPMSKELTSLDVAKGSGVVSAAEKDTLVITEPKKVTKKRVKRKIEEKDVDSSNKENESEVSAEIPLPPLPADWWGNKYGFVRAGHLGAQRDPPKVRTGDENATATSRDPSMRTAFREQDQEDLYNLVQDKATTGKKGLGRGDQPKKVGGAHWKGQKKAFDSSSEDEDEDEVEEEEEEEEESEVDQGTSSVDADGEGNLKKRKYGNVSACDRDNADAQENVAVIKATKKQKADTENKDVSDIVHLIAETPNEEKLEIIPSWRKLCKQVLTESPLQTLSFKRLQKRVVAAGLFSEEAQTSLEDKMAHLKQKLEKSSKFVVDGKMVSLATTKVGA
ncbi:Pin2-interacting protein X1 [Marchantia polymorpha subsp. ruderalis]|uniref:G-patch domain-containing protein n=2 Tax=Marchantia polymorpha TaxID=3197 RepID=A0AAF6BCA2_MARPO|nr:hypothetical protein MARPO_0090s0083 [Marchantia polymorpha]BBN09636.1 hypothetical protein Mp_4g21380 [Marchantia polymorpha subsp. ruderalis]|eukprot:PTQ33350.1 hypothetical protein MARPO_0090s0083 [Marchantia polymorpha]